jgi:callose synthase
MLIELNIELNNTFEDDIEVQRGTPSYRERNGFLDRVIIPIYNVLKAEADSNKGGSAPHSSWRNYDDMNEYFW